MEQFSENQYDDDLTVGANEFDDFSSTGVVDLFEFSTQEESPIARLKSLILSIDWEITDEILVEFNEELVDLQDVWAEEKVNLVYLQALGKISKYIYQHKANSHPNAIKLLLILYYNLEKIVSSEDLTAQQQQDILLEDVKRFESLKRQIAHQGIEDNILRDSGDEHESLSIEPKNDNELLQLKATVLGIDWEITDQDLNDLRQEVILLEEKYAESRPKLILLQGIGTLGAYIKVQKSNAHADAFKLLHLFFESLEKIVITPMSLEEEKATLFPAVDKFNTFKDLLGSLSSPDSADDPEDQTGSGQSGPKSKDLQPAFADIPMDDVKGFQEDEEARRLGLDGSTDVASQIETFFGEDTKESVDREAEDVEQVVTATGIDDEEKVESDGVLSLERELALQGVHVETEADDEFGEEPLPIEESGKLAPALAFGDDEEESIYSAETLEDFSQGDGIEEKLTETLDDFFVTDQEIAEPVAELAADPVDQIDPVSVDVEEPEPSSLDDFSTPLDDVTETDAVFSLDRELAMQGVHVETEADDDSDEEALPIEESGKLAPALSFGDSDETSLFSAEALDDPSLEEDVGEQVGATLEDFFVDEEDVSGTDEAVDEELARASLDSGVEDEPPVDPIVVEEEQPDLLPDEGEFGDTDEGFEEPELVEEVTEDEELLDSVIDDAMLAEPIVVEEEQLDPLSDEIEFADPSQGFDELELGGEDSAEEEVVFELVTGHVEYVEHDSMLALGEYIDSIGSELGDELFAGLYSEIDQLRHKWAANSLEKSFLQILSTVVKYIDKYRFESDPESYGLLKSNYDALGTLEEGMAEQNQELLLTEMSKVLQWQQNLLVQQSNPPQ